MWGRLVRACAPPDAEGDVHVAPGRGRVGLGRPDRAFFRDACSRALRIVPVPIGALGILVGPSQRSPGMVEALFEGELLVCSADYLDPVVYLDPLGTPEAPEPDV